MAQPNSANRPPPATASASILARKEGAGRRYAIRPAIRARAPAAADGERVAGEEEALAASEADG